MSNTKNNTQPAAPKVEVANTKPDDTSVDNRDLEKALADREAAIAKREAELAEEEAKIKAANEEKTALADREAAIANIYDTVVAKVKAAIADAKDKNGKGLNDDLRLTTEELDILRSLDGTRGKPLVVDRKKLWQRYVWLYSEHVMMVIQFDIGEGPVQERGELHYPIKTFSRNGVTLDVPKGVPVTVPMQIFEDHMSSYDPRQHRVEPITVNGMQSSPESYTQSKNIYWMK